MISERNQGRCDVPPVERVQLGPVTCFRQQPVYARAGGDRVARAHLQLSEYRLLERGLARGDPQRRLRVSPRARDVTEVETGQSTQGLRAVETGTDRHD